MSAIQHAHVKHQPSHVRIAGRYRGFPFDLEARKSSLKINRKTNNQKILQAKNTEENCKIKYSERSDFEALNPYVLI